MRYEFGQAQFFVKKPDGSLIPIARGNVVAMLMTRDDGVQEAYGPAEDIFDLRLNADDKKLLAGMKISPTCDLHDLPTRA